MSGLNRRLGQLETIWARSQPRPWRCWVQETDDPDGWFVDKATGERRRWADLDGVPLHGSIERVHFNADGSVESELRLDHGTGGLVVRWYGVDARLV